MRFKLLFVLVLLSLTSVSAQTTARKADTPKPGAPDETTISILHPEPGDTELAAKQGFHVFKLLPRGMHESENNGYDLRGGGAFYSFTKRSHSYNQMPQILLEKGNLAVGGFYGANYGFMNDLGAVDLSSVDSAQKEVAFLANYTPPLYEPDIRKEQRRSHDYSIDGLSYKTRFQAVAGHTYILRSIGFREADTLVALNVQRINDDGSVIIFWKSIKNFEAPKLLFQPDTELKAKVDEMLKDPRYVEITSSVKDNQVTLQGRAARVDLDALLDALRKENTMGVTNDVRTK